MNNDRKNIKIISTTVVTTLRISSGAYKALEWLSEKYKTSKTKVIKGFAENMSDFYVQKIIIESGNLKQVNKLDSVVIKQRIFKSDLKLINLLCEKHRIHRNDLISSVVFMTYKNDRARKSASIKKTSNFLEKINTLVNDLNRIEKINLKNKHLKSSYSDRLTNIKGKLLDLKSSIEKDVDIK